MIVFDLACSCTFQFEGWFKDREDFERQQAEGVLICLQCGANTVHKILSPVKRTSSAGKDQNRSAAPGPERLTPEVAAKTLQALQNYVKNNFEDVGPRLAAESLKMHYGVSETRNIRGVATPQEEETLRQEGIELLKIPMPAPDDDPVN